MVSFLSLLFSGGFNEFLFYAILFTILMITMLFLNKIFDFIIPDFLVGISVLLFLGGWLTYFFRNFFTNLWNSGLTGKSVIIVVIFILVVLIITTPRMKKKGIIKTCTNCVNPSIIGKGAKKVTDFKVPKIRRRK